MRRFRAPLSPASLRQVNRLLDELERVFVAEVRARTGRARADGDDPVIALTFLLSSAARRARKE
jgi:hypothetical protein